MIAILGTLAIIVNDLAAMWIGYQMGKERGIEECRTKRGIRKAV